MSWEAFAINILIKSWLTERKIANIIRRNDDDKSNNDGGSGRKLNIQRKQKCFQKEITRTNVCEMEREREEIN